MTHDGLPSPGQDYLACFASAGLDEAQPAAAPHPWYALQVRPRHEKCATIVLLGKGIEAYPALYRTSRRWSDRNQDVELPLFPGYVFSRFDASRRLPILTTPGVMSIVRFNRHPAEIAEVEIAAVQRLIRSGLPARPWPFLKVGQRVRVAQGSLSGMEGLVVREKGELRLVISVNLLQRSVAVEIERDWICPL